MLQLLPSGAEPSGEDVFIADSLNGIQLSHIKKALSDAGAFRCFYETIRKRLLEGGGGRGGDTIILKHWPGRLLCC